MKKGFRAVVMVLVVMVLTVLTLTACYQQSVRQPVKGTESSITGMNDITRLKVLSDAVPIRTGCSNTASVLQTAAKDSKYDVLSKVADWYAVKLPNNAIGFIPQKQSMPIIPDGKPGAAGGNAPGTSAGGTAPGTSAGGTAPGTAGTPMGASLGNLFGGGNGTTGKAPGTAGGATPGNAGNAPGTAGTNQNASTAAQTNSASMTAQEQQMLTLINQARAQAGAPALLVDMEVTKVARLKSQDMIDENYFSHYSPKYGSPFDMMKSFGINYVHAGENIAGNQGVQAAHNALMNSPGHRKNILSTDYTHVGIGIRSGGSYGMMFTQDFISKPR